MSKKIIAFILSLTLLTIELMGCGTTAEEETEETPADQVTITFYAWGDNAREKYLEEAIENFEAKNPGILVDMQYEDDEDLTLTRQDQNMLYGTAADVMLIDHSWLNRYKDRLGQVYADLIDAEEIDFEDYSEDVLEYGMSGGKLCAIPVSMTTSLPIFNKTIFEQYGLSIPTTWNEILECAEVLSKDDIYVFAMDVEDTLSLLFTYIEQTTGQRCFDDDGNVEVSPETLQQALVFYQELLDAKALCPMGEFDSYLIKQGKVAGVICSISDISSYSSLMQEAGGEGQVESFITGDDDAMLGYYVEPSYMYAISNSTNYLHESSVFLNYLVSDSDMSLFQKNEMGIPANMESEMVLMETGTLDREAYIAKVLMDYNMDSLTVKSRALNSEDYISRGKLLFEMMEEGSMSMESLAKVLVNNCEEQVQIYY